MYTAPFARARAPAHPGLMVLIFVLVLAMAMLVSPPAARAETDPWLGRDKALHFSASALIAGVGYGGASLLTEDRRWRLGAGAGLAIAAGAGKELADAWGYGDPSWRDFTWDLVGTATGLGLAWLIDRLIAPVGASPRRSVPSSAGGGPSE